MVNCTRSAGSLSGFPSRSNACATDFANAANGFGSVTAPACTRTFFASSSIPGSGFFAPLMVATTNLVCSTPIDPSANAAANSGSTGSATAPEGCTCGRTIFAVFTLALASGAEIVNVSRSRATVDADPKLAAVCRVSTSPATRTWAAYPSRARPSMDCANANRSSSGIFQKSMSCNVFRAAQATVTSACAESNTVSIPIQKH